MQSFLVESARFDVDTSVYKLDNPVGCGTYGIVCGATIIATGQKVAIKKLSSVFDSVTYAKRCLREVKILRGLKHEQFLTVIDLYTNSGGETCRDNFSDVYIVSELVDTDMEKVLRSEQVLPESHCQFFVFQLLCGLEYLHAARVIHRDLKPGNLLVNADCTLKICDFGMARYGTGDDSSVLETQMTQYVATRWYRAPEVVLGLPYSTAVDVWSVGCIFAELLLRRPVFPGASYISQLHVITDILGSPPLTPDSSYTNDKCAAYVRSLGNKPKVPWSQLFAPSTNPLVFELLDKMLEMDPRQRVTAAQALRHPYFADLFSDDHATDSSAADPCSNSNNNSNSSSSSNSSNSSNNNNSSSSSNNSNSSNSSNISSNSSSSSSTNGFSGSGPSSAHLPTQAAAASLRPSRGSSTPSSPAASPPPIDFNWELSEAISELKEVIIREMMHYHPAMAVLLDQTDNPPECNLLYADGPIEPSGASLM